MVISIISSVIIWGLVAVLIMRVLKFSGLELFGNNKYCAYITDDLRLGDKSQESCKTLKVFLAAFGFRLAILLLEIIILLMFNETKFTVSTLLRRLEIWDSSNYVRIATVGYGGYIEKGYPATLVFFPLYPYTAKLICYAVRNMHVALLLTSYLAYASGGVFLYKLCRMDHSEKTATRAVVYASIFPFAFFFGTMMSESMLFFTSLMTLYFIRKHNWLAAGIAGLFASLSRLVGVLVIVAAAVEFLEEYGILGLLKEKKFKEVWQHIYSKGLYLLLIPAGTVIYLIINKLVAGNWLAFLEIDKQIWGQSSQYFGTSLTVLAQRSFNWAERKKALTWWMPYLATVVFIVPFIIYGMRRNKSMYSAYFLAYFIINISVKYPISGSRYMTCAVPLFIVLADFAARHEKADKWITVMFSILFGIYLVAYLHDMIV